MRTSIHASIAKAAIHDSPVREIMGIVTIVKVMEIILPALPISCATIVTSYR